MNPCQTWVDRVWQVMDGELSDHESALLLTHLRTCQACQQEFRRAVRVQRLLTDQTMTAMTASQPLSADFMKFSAAKTAAKTTGKKTGKKTEKKTTARVSRPRTSRITRRSSRHGKRRQRSSMPLWLTGSLAAAVLMAVLLVLQQGTARAAPAAFAVIESASALSDQRGPIGAGAELMPDQLVTVAKHGQAIMVLADGSQLVVAGDSELALHRVATGTHIELRQGELAASVVPQRPAAPLTFITAEARAVVVGTELRFARRAGVTTLAVTHGAVRFITMDGSEQLVATGASATSAAAVKPTALTVLLDARQGLTVLDGQWISAWADQLGRTALAATPAQRPRYRVVDGRPVLCLEGSQQSLTLALDSIDLRGGFALVVQGEVMHERNDERLISLLDGESEILAITRSGFSPAWLGLSGSGLNVKASQPLPDGIGVYAALVAPNGHVDLYCGTEIVGSGQLETLGKITHANLGIARGSQGVAMDGNIYAVQCLVPAPDAAQLLRRLADLQANHIVEDIP